MSLEGPARDRALALLPCRVLALGWPEGFVAQDFAGSDLTVVDVQRHRGCEVFADLNDPQRLGRFDLVLDPGTTEHVANMAQALRTAIEAVALGGHLLQAIPVSMLNHGYWNVSPILLRDLYAANGLHLESAQVLDQQWRVVVEGDRLCVRDHSIPWEGVLYTVGRRVACGAWVWPRQGQYR